MTTDEDTFIGEVTAVVHEAIREKFGAEGIARAAENWNEIKRTLPLVEMVRASVEHTVSAVLGAQRRKF